MPKGFVFQKPLSVKIFINQYAVIRSAIIQRRQSAEQWCYPAASYRCCTWFYMGANYFKGCQPLVLHNFSNYFGCRNLLVIYVWASD